MNENRYLTFALGKGRLANKTMELLAQIGVTCEEMKDKDSRKLIFVNEELKLKFFLSKGPDVPTYVEYGAADIGVVGKDTLLESNDQYYEVMDLGIGKCRFILASLPENNVLKKQGHIKIGTKYPTVTKRYFKQKGLDVEIIKIDGSVELTPILGLCDAIVDIMETGTTLKENGLIVFDTVCEISARVIVNKASFRLKRNEIQELLNDLKNAIKETDYD